MSTTAPIRKIICIGGGNMLEGETLAIDQEIVRVTGKSNPFAVFIPTASFDDQGYTESFISVYESLSCRVEPLFLWDGYTREEVESIIQATKWNQEPTTWEFRGDARKIRDLISKADLIYVGGGNTKRMVELWRSAGVDVELACAKDRGCVLSGLSAGCICWAEFGNSDFALTEGLGRNTMRTPCLGFLRLTLCPHTLRETFRLGEFEQMMREQDGVGLGLDDNCALQVDGDQFRILASQPGSLAHLVISRHGDLRTRDLPPHEEWYPLTDLISTL